MHFVLESGWIVFCLFTSIAQRLTYAKNVLVLPALFAVAYMSSSEYIGCMRATNIIAGISSGVWV